MASDIRDETRALIEVVLSRPEWSKTKLAAALSINPTTLWRARSPSGDHALRSETLDRLRSIAAGAANAAEGPGDRLRMARRKAGISTKDLAKRVGLAESAVRNHENGTNGMKVEIAIRYAEELGVSSEWLLLGGDDHHTRTPGHRFAPGSLPIATTLHPLQMTALGNGKARLEMNMVVPMETAVKILIMLEGEPE